MTLALGRHLTGENNPKELKLTKLHNAWSESMSLFQERTVWQLGEMRLLRIGNKYELHLDNPGTVHQVTASNDAQAVEKTKRLIWSLKYPEGGFMDK